jgi:hypothetical protein
MERENIQIDIINNLYRMNLESEGIILPNNKVGRKSLRTAFSESFKFGKQVQIVSPVCPDYSFNKDEKDRYVYNFKELNGGIGLNAATVLIKSKLLLPAIKQCGVSNIEHQLLIADVEADDPLILASVGLDRDQFISKVGQSKSIIQQRSDNEVSVGILSEFIKPEDKERALFALLNIKETRIEAIAINRASLYRRWFGKLPSAQNIDFFEFAKLRAQADVLKYLEFGYAARREGVIILEATAAKIASLYNYGDGYIKEKGLSAVPPAPVIMIENDC